MIGFVCRSQMKYTDIQKIHEAGFISDQQRQNIVEHFKLNEESNRFLVIISFVGAVLVAAGIALLIAANWNEIPRGVKIATGLVLMLGAHAGGWWLREVRRDYRKSGEALHFVGSLLFLANISLVGQIYHIETRAPNAFLLWWLGIAAMPWLLRSKAQHILALLAFGVWFGFEINERAGLIYCGSERQLLLYALLGLVYFGAGYCLRETSFEEFAPATEKLGLFAFLLFIYPLTWKHFFGGWDRDTTSQWLFPVMSVMALLLTATGLRKLTNLTRQWRWTWWLTLLGMVGLLASVWFGVWQADVSANWRYSYWQSSWCYLVMTLALFVFCLLQIQVGIQERSPFLVNIGVVFIALDIIAAYLNLFGSMSRTGVMFLVSGVFLILFGIYLERKRRNLMRQIKTFASMDAAQ